MGKELLITVTSTKDSSKYFTILFKLGSTNIIALARYGGIAEDKIVDGKGLYDKKVYLLSDAGSGQGANSSIVYIIAGSDGLHLRGSHARTPADVFSTSTAGNEWNMSDFSEFVVTMSSTTGYEIDFTQINSSHSWN